MDNWIIIQQDPFEQLSAVFDPNHIITLECENNVLSLRDICLNHIKDYICTLSCPVCAIMSLDLPVTLEEDLIKLLPEDMELVSLK